MEKSTGPDLLSDPNTITGPADGAGAPDNRSAFHGGFALRHPSCSEIVPVGKQRLVGIPSITRLGYPWTLNLNRESKHALYAPRDVVPFQVHNGKDADFRGSNSIEDTVRKPAQNGMADFAMDDLILLRISRNQS